MKNQKKYLTRDQILKDIAKAHKKIVKLKAEAAQLDAAAEFQKLAGNQGAYEAAANDAESLWKKAERCENTRLKKLGATLAAFDTKPMFGDEQVVLQRLHD